MREVDAPTGLRFGRALPPQTFVVRRACRNHLHVRRGRHAAERYSVGRAHLPLEIVSAQRRRRRDVERECHRFARCNSDGQRNRTNAPDRIARRARRPQGESIGRLPRRRRRVLERLGDEDDGAGRYRCGNLLGHEFRRGRYEDFRIGRLFAEGSVQLRQHAEPQRRRGCETAAPWLHHEVESDLLIRGDVVRQEDTVSAVTAVRIVLNAPVVVVLRFLRCQEDVALGAVPGRGAGVLHRDRDRRGGLHLDEGWHRFRYEHRRISRLRLSCRDKSARRKRQHCRDQPQQGRRMRAPGIACNAVAHRYQGVKLICRPEVHYILRRRSTSAFQQQRRACGDGDYSSA